MCDGPLRNAPAGSDSANHYPDNERENSMRFRDVRARLDQDKPHWVLFSMTEPTDCPHDGIQICENCMYDWSDYTIEVREPGTDIWISIDEVDWDVNWVSAS